MLINGRAHRHVIISIFNGVLNPRTSFISSLGHEDKTWPSFNWFITCVKGGGGEAGSGRQSNEARRCSDHTLDEKLILFFYLHEKESENPFRGRR